MAIAMSVYSVGAISGAHINPAVMVGLASIGAFDLVMVPGYIIAQLLGAFTGGLLVYVAYLNHWEPTADPRVEARCVLYRPRDTEHSPSRKRGISGPARSHQNVTRSHRPG